MDNQVLQYISMGYHIDPSGRVTDPYNDHVEVDKLNLDGVSIPCLEKEILQS